MDDKIKEKLSRLKALAERGIGGERDNAGKLLDKLLNKYGARLDELDDEQEQDFFFKYSGKEQQALLTQVASYVIGESEHCFYCATPSGKRSKTKICIACTKAQKLEIEFLFDFYKRLWEKEKKTILTAFCLKHELFPRKTSEISDGEKPTSQEIERIKKAMQMLSDEQPLAAITGTYQKGR